MESKEERDAAKRMLWKVDMEMDALTNVLEDVEGGPDYYEFVEPLRKLSIQLGPMLDNRFKPAANYRGVEWYHSL